MTYIYSHIGKVAMKPNITYKHLPSKKEVTFYSIYTGKTIQVLRYIHCMKNENKHTRNVNRFNKRHLINSHFSNVQSHFTYAKTTIAQNQRTLVISNETRV